MKRWVCAFAVVCLALTGCSGSICEQYKDAEADLTEKAKPCSDGSTGSEEPFDVQQCESEISKCSDADMEAVEEYIDCLGDVDKCVKDQEQVFGGAVLNCAFTAASKLSEACTTVLTQEIQRAAAGYSVAR